MSVSCVVCHVSCACVMCHVSCVNDYAMNGNKLLHLYLQNKITDRTLHKIGQHCPNLRTLFIYKDLTTSARGIESIIDGCSALKKLSLERDSYSFSIVSCIFFSASKAANFSAVCLLQPFPCPTMILFIYLISLTENRK
jgi:hypothetical protein